MVSTLAPPTNQTARASNEVKIVLETEDKKSFTNQARADDEPATPPGTRLTRSKAPLTPPASITAAKTRSTTKQVVSKKTKKVTPPVKKKKAKVQKLAKKPSASRARAPVNKPQVPQPLVPRKRASVVQATPGVDRAIKRAKAATLAAARAKQLALAATKELAESKAKLADFQRMQQAKDDSASLAADALKLYQSDHTALLFQQQQSDEIASSRWHRRQEDEARSRMARADSAAFEHQHRLSMEQMAATESQQRSDGARARSTQFQFEEVAKQSAMSEVRMNSMHQAARERTMMASLRHDEQQQVVHRMESDIRRREDDMRLAQQSFETTDTACHETMDEDV